MRVGFDSIINITLCYQELKSSDRMPESDRKSSAAAGEHSLGVQVLIRCSD